MHYKKFHAVQVTPDIPQNQHSTLCAKNPSTLNNLFYKPNKAVPVLFGKNVIICNKAGFSKSIAYFQAVVGGANATKKQAGCFCKRLACCGMTMVSDNGAYIR